jgi:hypothetical protein
MRDLEEKLNTYVTSNKSFDFENYLNEEPSARNILNKIETQLKPTLTGKFLIKILREQIINRKRIKNKRNSLNLRLLELFKQFYQERLNLFLTYECQIKSFLKGSTNISILVKYLGIKGNRI